MLLYVLMLFSIEWVVYYLVKSLLLLWPTSTAHSTATGIFHAKFQLMAGLIVCALIAWIIRWLGLERMACICLVR